MTVMALDLSSTATGVCIDGDTLTWKPRGDLHDRARVMAANTGYTYDTAQPSLVVIEAIGTRHVQTAIAIATVHALVLFELRLRDAEVLMVSPASLKKWATGKGNADKTAMILSAVKAGWKSDVDATDDQADAWWLWTIGAATFGVNEVPLTVPRLVVLEGLT